MEFEIKELKDKMQKAISVLQSDLLGLRTGRASTSIFEKIMVDYYGAKTRLSQLAQISAPESNLIVINPYDKTILTEIEKAILSSELSLNPASDGKLLRIKIPPLTKERRVEIIKTIKTMAEKSKVALRNIRRDFLEKLKKQKKEGFSEDEEKRFEQEIQIITDKHIKEIDEILLKKEKEISEN